MISIVFQVLKQFWNLRWLSMQPAWRSSSKQIFKQKDLKLEKERHQITLQQRTIPLIITSYTYLYITYKARLKDMSLSDWCQQITVTWDWFHIK